MLKKPDVECAKISSADVLAALRRAAIKEKRLSEFHGTPYVVSELIEASGTFAINIPCVAQIDTVQKVGTSSGRDLKDTDKFALHGLETFSAKKIDVPLLKGCVGWLECKVIPEPHNQNTYDLFIAEVVAAYADERVFSQSEDGQFRWHFEDYDDLRTIHHVAGGRFFATGEVHQAGHSA